MRAARLTATLGAAGTLLALAVAPPAASAASHRPSSPRGASDVREVPQGKEFGLDQTLQAALRHGKGSGTSSPSASPSVRSSLTAQGTSSAPVGTVRKWLALDDYNGKLYLKDYTLKAVGAQIEVWVANDTAFPAGDCREQVPGTTTVTADQAQALADQFDTNMYPKESAAFSTPPDRDGSKSPLAGRYDFTGPGDKIVTLVDNVRDDNFYDFPEASSYIAGFFSSQFNALTDRNVMTIDAFDWAHRTGANPPNDPSDDVCTSRQARPRLYEGTFAHEYQHLLESYQDPGEATFVNEGLSDFAISLVGYGNPTATVFEPGNESHIVCFQGFGTVKTDYNVNPRDCGGPANSLTRWGDQGSDANILADYGIAWSFQLFLYDRYGQEFISALHRDGEAQGLQGVQDQLDRFAPGTDVYDVVHDFQLMNLLDHAVDGGKAKGDTDTARVSSASLDQRLNLLNPKAYAAPGAAPNGADYVTLRTADQSVLSGKQLQSVSFEGAGTLAPQPLLWTSVTDAPGREGDPTLWSGNTSNRYATAIVEVTVPQANPTLTYTERHLAEKDYDYAYTVVSTDGGKTYTALANDNTVEGPLGPALNGDAAGFATQTFDLSAYAGQKVLLGFRYVSDGGVNDGGWYVDDVSVGGTLLSDGSDASVFRSSTQVRPIEVANWDVRLVGLDEAKGKAFVRDFDGQRSFSLSGADLAQFKSYPTVIAVVAYDDPSQQVQQSASYTLSVNGVVQAGG
ncbi:MAG: choice-of-anchor J domain-containing protein [Motilibacteraceae bacterium]